MATPPDASDLRRRRAPLELSADEFRTAGHELVDRLAEFLAGLSARPVTRGEAPGAVRRLLPSGGPPEDGRAAGELLREIAPLLIEHSLHNGHPRFFGYITSSAAPIGALADLLAAAVNPNLGAFELSPLATEIEKQCVAWIAALVGCPPDTGGLLVSGGNMANFIGLLAARRSRAGAAVREEGVGAAALRVYASEETHTWIQKAADLLGLGTRSLRLVPVDARQRVRIDELRAAIARDRAAGERPFLIVGNAGTVSTGAVDPLPQLADLAAEHGLWFHVDGAYGAPAVLADGAPAELAALSRADSLALDPHKWLYAPLEAGCVLVRDPERLLDAFGYRPAYYPLADAAEDPELNYYAYGPQNSRGFRALKVWLGLRQVGRSGYARMIADDMRLAAELFRRVGEHPRLEPATLGLSIATFRYAPAELRERPEAANYLDALNEALLVRLRRGGEAFLTNARIDGRFLLRACIVNFRTTLDDVEAVPGIVAGCGDALDAEMRPAALGS